MNEHDPKKRIKLHNAACVYCNKAFDSMCQPEEEHVIGRKFVPKGSLASQWNLIVNACGSCNDRKSELENDLSAIVMRPDARYRHDSGRLADEARRKETAISKRTRKPVRDSNEELTVRSQLMPGVNFSANLVAGPQFDNDRAEQLALFHVSAFFYLITYNETDKRGKPIPGSFCPIATVCRSDWGNAQMVGFQEMIATWRGRLYAIGADTFFKITIQRSPVDEPPLWAWALEWNHSVRVVGVFGDGKAAQVAFDRLPILKKVLVERGIDPKHGPFESWARPEVALDEKHDKLFKPFGWTDSDRSN